MGISIDIDKFIILEKTPSKFGNSSHVFISKKFIGEKVKIIIGNCKITKNQIKLDFFKSEILERQVNVFSTGAHIIIPKEYSGEKIKIILRRKNE